ncbi:IdeS/Mac family cysteine endopeptidase [Clostridium septicum]|uniref:IdeS/Mac family cysteine endopeptidase n=1 Tax=Clostridium septicum TaxID=1504 RepID=UPI00272EDBE7|nr:IdeS/Mac family cysteine endopeptidase [Clostridium septicum]WLF69154.1 IdeS/Mac family cysteine endopeptidase [Clostridium septicum]
MIKKNKIISAILLAGILSLNFSKSLTTYADLTTLNYDSKYDLNNDSIINELDIDKISKHYNNQKDSADWAEELDFNNDGIIDIFDIIKISKRNGIKRTIKRTIKKTIKKSPENALEFQNLLAANKNVTTTKDAAGKKIYNVWVKGITPPTESDFTTLNLGANYSINVAPWKPGQGWYDINKTKNGSGDNLLCSGAVATNMLHWWLDQNKEYIDRYLAQNPENGKNLNKTLDIRTSSTFHDQKNSDIFNLIKKYFRNNILATIRTLLWYINGSSIGLPNSPHLDARAGFLSGIFKKDDLIDVCYIGAYDLLNIRLLEWLQEDKVLGISHENAGVNYNHIITLWGASFDEAGNLLGIYVTDSDDEKSKISNDVLYGMKYYRTVKDPNGRARMTTYNGKENNRGAKLLVLSSFNLGKDQWEEYFNKDNN